MPPVDWTFEPVTGVARVNFTGRVMLPECLQMVGEVSAKTRPLGHCSLILNATGMTASPDFSDVMKIVRFSHELRNPERPSHYAIVANPGDSVYGKSRQVLTLLESFGIRAEVFDNEGDALAWCAEHNPRLSDGAGRV